MILGFYYHYAVFQSEGKNFLPGFLGCFVDSLAKEVEQLLLVCHITRENKQNLHDYALQSPNITLVPIGARTPAWHRHLFHHRILRQAKKQLQHADFLLVRSPTPLAPFFRKVIEQKKLVYLVVGDYEESVKQLPTRNWRDWIMKKYIARNDALFKREMKHTHVLVNAPSLFTKYQSLAMDIHRVKTTTLSSDDFYTRNGVLEGNEVRILYTGRIDPAKGLFELLEALPILQQRIPSKQITLHLVGWEEGSQQPVTTALKKRASDLGILESVFFHGKKKIGSELNAMYRMADLYLIPSYHEGFPRTIWEAMANGLPVIATRVGAIPEYLKDKQDALLIAPKQIEPIVNAVEELLANKPLAQRIMAQGYSLAKENTLEIQSKRLITLLKQFSQQDSNNE